MILTRVVRQFLTAPGVVEHLAADFLLPMPTMGASLSLVHVPRPLRVVGVVLRPRADVGVVAPPSVIAFTEYEAAECLWDSRNRRRRDDDLAPLGRRQDGADRSLARCFKRLAHVASRSVQEACVRLKSYHHAPFVGKRRLGGARRCAPASAGPRAGGGRGRGAQQEHDRSMAAMGPNSGRSRLRGGCHCWCTRYSRTDPAERWMGTCCPRYCVAGRHHRHSS